MGSQGYKNLERFILIRNIETNSYRQEMKQLKKALMQTYRSV